MAEKGSKIVLLPDGTNVTISSTPQDWWLNHTANGYASPSQLAPDPKNPRKKMSESQKAELDESVKSRGVRETIVVTPLKLAPWAKVAPQDKDKPFLIVSGHRRNDSAQRRAIQAVPIKVMIYADEKDHRLDVSLLNKNRADLTELEKGYEIVELQKIGWKIEQLKEHFGVALPQLYGRIYLTRLDPSIQCMVDESLPRERQLTLTVGGHLGSVKVPTFAELQDMYDTFAETLKGATIASIDSFEGASDDQMRFGLQKVLLTVIRRRGLSADRAVDFIRDHKIKLSASGSTGRKPYRHEPARRKQVLANLMNEINGSVVLDWKKEEIRRIFELSTREDIEEVIGQLENAAALLCGIAKVLVPVRDSKKSMSDEVRKLMGSSSHRSVAE